jgi:hypothetical protein
MTLKEKARRMRNAIEDIELALNGADALLDWPDIWEGDGRSEHITAELRLTGMAVCRISEAYRELNKIANDPAFAHAEFAT